MSATQALRDQAEAFCRQHRSGDMVVLPNAWDPGSAALMAAAGFPVIATTSGPRAKATLSLRASSPGRMGKQKPWDRRPPAS